MLDALHGAAANSNQGSNLKYALAGRQLITVALSTRSHNVVTSAYNWCERGNPPRTIGDLAFMSSMELMRVPGLGKIALREIRAALARHDLYLRDEGPIAAHRRPAGPPPGLDGLERCVMASDTSETMLFNRALIRALLRYVRRLERDVAEGSFW